MTDLAKATAAVRAEAGSKLCSWSATRRVCTREAGASFCICENVAKAALNSQLPATVRLGRWDLSQPGLAVDGDTIVHLPKHCYRLAVYLAQRPNQRVASAVLYQHASNRTYFDEANIRSSIKRLKKRLGADTPIEPVWGFGYIYKVSTPTGRQRAVQAAAVNGDA